MFHIITCLSESCLAFQHFISNSISFVNLLTISYFSIPIPIPIPTQFSIALV